MNRTLTAVLREVLQAPPPPRSDNDGETRRAPRYAVRARVTVQLLAEGGRVEGRPEKVWMRDIAATGVGFLHNKALPVGQELLLNVPGLDDLSPLRCAVRRCQRASSDIVIIGASFTAPPGTRDPAIDAAVAAAAAADVEPAAASGKLSDGQVTRLGAHCATRGQLADAPAAAAAVAEQVKRATAASRTPTALLALDRRILWANPAFARLVRYPDEGGLAGLAIDAITHPDDVQLDAHLAGRLSAGALLAYRTTKRLLCRDGSPVAVDLSANALRDVAGRALFVLVTVERAGAAAPNPSPAPASTPAVSTEDSEAERIRRAMFD